MADDVVIAIAVVDEVYSRMVHECNVDFLCCSCSRDNVTCNHDFSAFRFL